MCRGRHIYRSKRRGKTEAMSDRKDRIHIDEVIVVEGRDDTSAVLAAVDGITLETHGYGIRQEVWQALETAYERSGLIIFTDPDPAGERIRRRLAERFPKAKHAFLEMNDAIKGDDIGIENATPEDIRRALSLVRGPVEEDPTPDISKENPGPEQGLSMTDMDKWGLNGSYGASKRRRALGKELGVGFADAKTFLKRLNHFGVSRREVEEALVRITS